MCNKLLAVVPLEQWSDPSTLTQEQRLGYVFRHNYNPLAAKATENYRYTITPKLAAQMRALALDDPALANELLAAFNWGEEKWRDIEQMTYGELAFFTKAFKRQHRVVTIDL